MMIARPFAPSPSEPVLVRCAMVADAERVEAAPGALLVERGRIVAAGAPAVIGAMDRATIVERPDLVVLPGLVNAHAHLDLSHCPPARYGGDFVAWIGAVRAQRRADDAGIAEATRRGVDLSLAGGTAIVGDIAGAMSVVPTETLDASPLRGVSFVEFFGLGSRADDACRAMRDLVARPPVSRIRLGLQPHAPYSCGPAVYRVAASLGVPVSTHLAETPDEIAFARDHGGPFAAFLRDLGVPVDEIPPLGAHPIDALADALRRAPFLVAHVNYADPAHDAILRDAGATVAYCPRASAYFGHVDHPWRRLREAGVPVALGTDGLACLDTPERLGVLDEMRLLLTRDGADARDLLAMATLDGARGLGMDPALVTLAPGATAGVIGVPIGGDASRDLLARAIESTAAPEWIVHPRDADDGGGGAP